MAKKSIRVVNSNQEQIPGTEQEEQARPKTVIGDRMLVEYVKPHYEKNKDGERFVAMEFSLGLTRDHAGKMPDSVEDSWKFLRKAINRSMAGIEIDPQVVHVYLTSDAKEAEISTLFAEITHGALAIVEERGSGKAAEVTRFSFRVRLPVDGTVCEFADNSFGNSLWLSMEEAQRSLTE